MTRNADLQVSTEQSATVSRVHRAEASWLTPAEAAEYLGLATQSLAYMRHMGKGPVWARPSPRIVRYRRADLESWLSSATVRSTSEAAARDRDHAAA